MHCLSLGCPETRAEILNIYAFPFHSRGSGSGGKEKGAERDRGPAWRPSRSWSLLGRERGCLIPRDQTSTKQAGREITSWPHPLLVKGSSLMLSGCTCADAENPGVSRFSASTGDPQAVRRSKTCLCEAGPSIRGRPPQRQRGWTGERGGRSPAGLTRAQGRPCRRGPGRKRGVCGHLTSAAPWRGAWGFSAPGSPHLPPTQRWFEA